MDKSLDDIIVRVDYRGGRGSRNRRNGGVGPIRFRDGGVRSRRPVPYSRARDIAHQRDHGGLNEGTELFLSNLSSGLDGDDIRGLFRRFGRVRDGTVHYDRSGVPLGTGTVTFERRADATEAMQQQDNIRLVGRPVMMEILLSDSSYADSRRTGQNTRSFARRGGRGLRGGRRGRGGPIATGRTPTAQELDAELDAYVCERERIREEYEVDVEEEYEVEEECSIEEEDEAEEEDEVEEECSAEEEDEVEEECSVEEEDEVDDEEGV